MSPLHPGPWPPCEVAGLAAATEGLATERPSLLAQATPIVEEIQHRFGDDDPPLEDVRKAPADIITHRGPGPSDHAQKDASNILQAQRVRRF